MSVSYLFFVHGSFEEFLQQTKKPEFERDQGWEPLDEQQIYTQDEYTEFERRRQEEIHRLIQEGKVSIFWEVGNIIFYFLSTIFLCLFLIS